MNRYPTTRAHRDACNTVAAKIAALPTSKDIELFAPRVIAAFAGESRDVFTELDDAIGNCSRRFDFNDKGWMVRRVRNDPTWGKKLFAALVR